MRGNRTVKCSFFSDLCLIDMLYFFLSIAFNWPRNQIHCETITTYLYFYNFFLIFSLWKFFISLRTTNTCVNERCIIHVLYYYENTVRWLENIHINILRQSYCLPVWSVKIILLFYATTAIAGWLFPFKGFPEMSQVITSMSPFWTFCEKAASGFVYEWNIHFMSD